MDIEPNLERHPLQKPKQSSDSGAPREGLIYKAINDVMKKIDAVSKDRKNQDQGFSYRGIDDIYNAIHTGFSEAGVFCAPNVLSRELRDHVTRSGAKWYHVILQTVWKFYATDGSSVDIGPIFSEGLDSGDKATNKALAVGHKYALMQMFMIPTEDETKDPDSVTPPERQGDRQPPRPSQPSGRNPAPAFQAQVNEMFELMSKRQIQSEELKHMVKEIYGIESTANLKQWQVAEINTLLADPATTSTTILARAEAKSIKPPVTAVNETSAESRRVNDPGGSVTQVQQSNALPESARSSSGHKPGVFQAAKVAAHLGPKIAARQKERESATETFDPGDYVVPFGKDMGVHGKRIKDLPETKLREALAWANDQKAKGKAVPGSVLEFQQYAKDFFASMGLS